MIRSMSWLRKLMCSRGGVAVPAVKRFQSRKLAFEVLEDRIVPTAHWYLVAQAPQSNYEGATVALTVAADNQDGDPVTLAVSGLPSGLSLTYSDIYGQITGVVGPGASASSPYLVTVSATDTVTNVTTSETIDWTVNQTIVTLTSPGDQTNIDGQPVGIQVIASDTASHPVVYSATGLPSGLTIDPNTGIIQSNIANNASLYSPYSSTITATDTAADVSASQTVNWTVSQPTVTLSSPGDQSNFDGDTVDLPISASDSVGNALSFAATGLPSGLSIDSGSGVISGAIASNADASGPYAVTLTATDSAAGVSASRTISWGVSNPVNLTSPGDQGNFDGDTVDLPISASDSAGHSLSLAATGLPSGLSMNSSSGVISGTIASNADASGPYSVTLTATDAAVNVSASQTINWVVSPPPPAIASVLIDNYLVDYSGDTLVSTPDNATPDDVVTAQVNTTIPADGTVTYQYCWTVSGQTVQTDNTTSVTDTLDMTQIGDGESGDQVNVTVSLIVGGTTSSQGAAEIKDMSAPTGTVWYANRGAVGPMQSPVAPTLNYPAGATTYAFPVGEGSPQGVQVGQITATSNSGNANAYAIIGGNGNGWFSIDSTGVITVATANLPITSTTQFNLTVAVADLANPGLSQYQVSGTVQVILRPSVVITGDFQAVVAPIDGGEDNIDLKFVRVTYDLSGSLTVPYTINWMGLNQFAVFANPGDLANVDADDGQVTFAAGQNCVDVVLVPIDLSFDGGQAQFNVQLTTPAAGAGYTIPPHNVALFVPSMTMTGYDNANVFIYDGTCLFASQNDLPGLADANNDPTAPDYGIDINDITQGALGDCFLLAALGALAKNNPQFIHNMIQVNGDGTATIDFYSAVGAAPFPVEVSMSIDGGSTQAQLSGDYQLSEDGTHREWEIWPQIVEKAYAQYIGGISTLNDGGSSYLVWQQLTGSAANQVLTADLDAAAIGNAIAFDLAAGEMVVVSSNSTIANPNVTVNGVNYQVTTGHAYVVLAVGTDTLTLFNPWGGDPNDPSTDNGAITGPVIYVPLANFNTYFFRIQTQ
jgi:hypothetical protein